MRPPAPSSNLAYYLGAPAERAAEETERATFFKMLARGLPAGPELAAYVEQSALCELAAEIWGRSADVFHAATHARKQADSIERTLADQTPDSYRDHLTAMVARLRREADEQQAAALASLLASLDMSTNKES